MELKQDKKDRYLQILDELEIYSKKSKKYQELRDELRPIQVALGIINEFEKEMD